VTQTQDALLIHAAMPWRADWVSKGFYDDGWTRASGVVHVFARRQGFPREVRYLTFQIRAPSPRPFTVRSNLETKRGTATGATSFVTVRVCVGTYGAEVRVSTPVVTAIPADLGSGSAGPRQGGLFVAQIALSDDSGGPCTV
jgi:hypothetical protein